MKRLKKIIKLLMPPIFFWIVNYISEFLENQDTLFLGNDALFKERLFGCKVYGEYGCGKSTIWVANNTSAKILSVDSSEEWINEVNSKIDKTKDVAKLKYVNLGALGTWGRPISYQYYTSFDLYTDWIWMQDELPDVVLIDGRFRVCCFLTCLKFANERTAIIFDDYIDREEYKFIEKYLEASKIFGRQALFLVPNKKFLDLEELNRDITRFRFVMD